MGDPLNRTGRTTSPSRQPADHSSLGPTRSGDRGRTPPWRSYFDRPCGTLGARQAVGKPLRGLSQQLRWEGLKPMVTRFPHCMAGQTSMTWARSDRAYLYMPCLRYSEAWPRLFKCLATHTGDDSILVNRDGSTGMGHLQAESLRPSCTPLNDTSSLIFSSIGAEGFRVTDVPCVAGPGAINQPIPIAYRHTCTQTRFRDSGQGSPRLPWLSRITKQLARATAEK